MASIQPPTRADIAEAVADLTTLSVAEAHACMLILDGFDVPDIVDRLDAERTEAAVAVEQARSAIHANDSFRKELPALDTGADPDRHAD